ncbi:MAG TPA: hypothetical protein VEI02_00945 [Planctomycetota bacterium]|nr:hypothetical protein [Planctomycetota bacterium]
MKELETTCGVLLKAKGVDWRRATEPLLKEAKKTRSHEEHAVWLTRLLARLRDGHAEVRLTEKTRGSKAPVEPKAGPGMFLCRAGDRVSTLNAFGAAAAAGVTAGAEIFKLDGLPATEWLDRRVADLRDRVPFSTDHQADAFACRQGLAAAPGTKLAVEFKGVEGASKRATVVVGRDGFVHDGPAFFPAGLEKSGDLRFGRTPKGYGYLHIRRCASDLAERLDAPPATLAGAAGLILDLRGNSGGGFDHDAFMGRFVPAGETLAFKKR